MLRVAGRAGQALLGSGSLLSSLGGARSRLRSLGLGSSPEKKTPVHSLTSVPRTHHLKPELDPSADAVEISFLSTARAGTIIVGEHELRRAIDALEAEKALNASAESDPDALHAPVEDSAGVA